MEKLTLAIGYLVSNTCPLGINNLQRHSKDSSFSLSSSWVIIFVMTDDANISELNNFAMNFTIPNDHCFSLVSSYSKLVKNFFLFPD